MEKEASDERLTELLELMEVPEIRQIILSKLQQCKLIFRNEVEDLYKRKNPNLMTFVPPLRVLNKERRENQGIGKDTRSSGPGKRVEWNYARGFFDTTAYMGLSEGEQVAIFLDYFNNNKDFRKQILFEFFLQKMPYSDSFENAG